MLLNTSHSFPRFTNPKFDELTQPYLRGEELSEEARKGGLQVGLQLDEQLADAAELPQRHLCDREREGGPLGLGHFAEVIGYCDPLANRAVSLGRRSRLSLQQWPLFLFRQGVVLCIQQQV